MIMNQDDKRRYEWLRTKFACTDIKDDGTYKPVFAFTMPISETLDSSIDKAMGVTPTHEPLEPVFTVDELAEVLFWKHPGHLWIGSCKLNESIKTEIKAALFKLKAGE